MIRVDVYEPQVIREALEGLEEVSVEPLPAGDYVWTTREGKVRGIERKSVTDLVSSLFSGRLEEQLAKCVDTYDVVDLLVEDPISVTYDGSYVLPLWRNGKPKTLYSRISPPALACLLSSVCEHNIGILFSPNMEITAEVLQGLYRRDQGKKKRFLRSSVKRPPTSVYHIGDNVATVLAVWDRLPEGLAEKLCKKYGNLWGILNTDPKELRKIKGVGNTLIENLYRKVGKNGKV